MCESGIDVRMTDRHHYIQSGNINKTEGGEI